MHYTAHVRECSRLLSGHQARQFITCPRCNDRRPFERASSGALAIAACQGEGGPHPCRARVGIHEAGDRATDR